MIDVVMKKEEVLFLKALIRGCIKSNFVKDEKGNIDEDESVEKITNFVLTAMEYSVHD